MPDNTTAAKEVFDSFESSFQDKRVIPFDLELLWLKKAVGRFSVELKEINFDAKIGKFDRELSRYEIDTLAAFMKQSYQEREVSRINKMVSIVGKDLSIGASSHNATSARNELLYDESKANIMVDNQKPTAYV